MSSREVAGPTPGERVRQLADEIFPYHLRYEKDRDPRAVFAYVYYNITLDLAEKLEDPAEDFVDRDWVADLGIAFGNRFRQAMDAIDLWLATPSSDRKPIEEVVPDAWADVYLAIRDGQSYVLEDLVFSMMAHISYDLPLALRDVSLEGERLADYHRMNEVLAGRIEFIQNRVAERYQWFLMALAYLAGSFDEFLTNYGIRVARSVAWYNSQRLGERSSRDAAESSINASTGDFIRGVRRPDFWFIRCLVRLARLLLPRGRKWPEPPPERARRSLQAKRASRW